MKPTTAKFLATAMIAATLGVAGCGGDEESPAETSTTAAETSTTTAEEATTTTDADAGGFADAAASLEAAGFDLDEKAGQDLVQTVGYPKPITAVAGAVVTMPGTPGDILVYEFASEAEAAEFVKVNTDDILQADSVGTIAVSSTANNSDQLDEAIAALGG